MYCRLGYVGRLIYFAEHDGKGGKHFYEIIFSDSLGFFPFLFSKIVSFFINLILGIYFNYF